MSFWSTYFLIGAVTTAWGMFKLQYLKERAKDRKQLAASRKKLGKVGTAIVYSTAPVISAAVWPIRYAVVALRIYRTGKRY